MTVQRLWPFDMEVHDVPVLTEKLTEREKYEKIWEHPQYRENSPGEQAVMYFLSQARPMSDATLIDYGAGTGRAAFTLALMAKLRVTMVDFASNCLDPEVFAYTETQPTRIGFKQHDLTQPLDITSVYGFCTDVLEHIPPEQVDLVLHNILTSSQHVWFQISTEPDRLGALIGETLHLTVQPFAWWLAKLQQHGMHVHYSQNFEGHCVVYGTAWATTKQVVMAGEPNAGEQQLNANVIENLKAGWPQIQPHEAQELEIVLLAGGPSLNDFVDDIRAHRKRAPCVITVNGTYNWAIEHQITPSALIMVDGREFMDRFVRVMLPDCKYLMASQVSPKVMACLPRDRTWLWHSGINKDGEKLARELNNGLFFPIPGGCTVVTRAIPLLRMLGFSKIHVYGFDSCMNAGVHHAYAQTENDGELVLPVSCGGRTFECTPWQVTQAQEFMGLVSLLGSEMELAVYGDGLIAQIINTGASMEHSFQLT
jgi:hypothetical protein